MCPQLRVLCFETRLGLETIPCYGRPGLICMAEMRAETGRPLERVIIRADLPSRRQVLAGLFPAMAPRLRACIGRLELRGLGGDFACPFKLHEGWKEDEHADRYWQVDPLKLNPWSCALP